MISPTKTILLLRHGKSDWDAPYGGDHQRPLAKRGVRAARHVGDWLTRLGQAPDLVLTSDATRALTTAELAAEAGGWSCPIERRPDFYSSQVGTLLSALQALDEEITTVLLAGHQPTWSATVAALTGGGNVHFPTAAVACLEYHGSWPALDADRCALRWLVNGKLLAKATTTG